MRCYLSRASWTKPHLRRVACRIESEAKVEAKPEAAFDSAFFAVDLRRIPILGQRMTSLSLISRVVSSQEPTYSRSGSYQSPSQTKEGMALAVGF